MPKPKIFVVGSAVADVIVEDHLGLEDLLDELGMELGNSYKISKEDADRIEEIIAALGKPFKVSSGGSIANTADAIAKASDAEITLLCGVGNDKHGDAFIDDLDSVGIKHQPGRLDDEDATTTISYVIPKDGDRILPFYSGSAPDFIEADHIDKEMVSGADYVMLEGFVFSHANGKEIVQKLVDNMDKGILVMALSADWCAEANREQMQGVIKSRGEMIFGNADELKALYDKDDLDAAIELLQKDMQTAIDGTHEDAFYAPVAFITDGKEGVKIITEDTVETVLVDALDKKDVKNTVGAGDNFMAGVMFAFIQKNGEIPDHIAAKIGSYFARQVIQQDEARLENPLDAIPESLRGELRRVQSRHGIEKV